ncbi:unnamed protein product [Mucor hiemalis]
MRHNHSTNEEYSLSTPHGRKNHLSTENVKKLQQDIEQKIPTKLIQKSLSSMNKRIDLKSTEGAALLLYNMESQGFITIAFSRNDSTEFFDGLFFTNQVLIERAKRFPGVILIDATYNKNDLRTPLICAYGVSNVGKEKLKTFPIAFAWVADEKED